MQKISTQVEKNRDSLLVQEASLREYQIRSGSSEAEKVTPEPPKTGLDRQQTSFDRDITPAAVYRGAFGNYASGRYQQAILGFSAFLERYPDNPYAANARFWIGECHYVLDEYPQALEAFEAVVNFRTPSDKAPDALLRMVSILKKLRSDQRAEETADFLVKKYPDSLAARTLREYYPEYKAP